MGVQVRETRSRDHERSDIPEQEPENRPEKPTRLKNDLDQLLDAFDDILAENEEMLSNFVQKSGE